MSLKAKIEAVVYASEEPVTLAQLVGLLGGEGQAELDAIAARQPSLVLPVRETEEPEAGEGSVASAAPEALGEGEALPLDAAIVDAGRAGQGSATPDEAAKQEAPQEAHEEGLVAGEKKLAAAAATDARVRERRLRDHFRSLLDQLIAEYANGDRGLEIREVAGGFRFGTKAEFHDAVRGFVKSLKPPLKLTLQALETLAVVAYKQPVTAPEVSEIRGVDSAGVLGSLLTRKLVTTAGRKQVIGRPILYKTTKDFLLRFGLKDINELPSIEEFEKMASELNEAVQEEIALEAAEGSAAGSTPVSSSAAGAAGGETDRSDGKLEGMEERMEGTEAPGAEFHAVKAEGPSDEKA